MSAKIDTIGKFLDELASDAPTPAAAARRRFRAPWARRCVRWCAISPSAKRYEAVSSRSAANFAKAEKLRAELTAGVDEDVVAFNTLLLTAGWPAGVHWHEEETKGEVAGQSSRR